MIRVGYDEEHQLFTNLFDDKSFPAEELILLYHKYWEQELVFDELKTHQDPLRATKPTHLRSETPNGAIQELYALSLAHFVIRALMFKSTATIKLDPVQLSFTDCFKSCNAEFQSAMQILDQVFKYGMKHCFGK